MQPHPPTRGWLRRGVAVAFAATAVAAAGAVTAVSAQASATHRAGKSTAGPVPRVRLTQLVPDIAVRGQVTRAEADKAAAAHRTVPVFEARVKVGHKKFTYIMVGKNPAVRHASPAVTVKAVLVPVVVKFANGDIWDPTKADSCDPGASALTRVQQSPVVMSHYWTWGGTPIGTGQVTDAFQRAEFWKYARPGGVNPGYAVNLAWQTASPVTLHVPTADASTAASPNHCGNGLVGVVKVAWLSRRLQQSVIPSLASQGVGPTTLPVFLVHNVVESLTTPKPAIGGFHTDFNIPGGVQTYAWSLYNNSGAGVGTDITDLSHELAEWQDDPFTNNVTPAWGHIGQVTGCQANLEVGDPLNGTTFADTVGGFTYHPQELAFFSWFYRQRPSIGVNGWYSNQGTFTTPAAPCK